MEKSSSVQLAMAGLALSHHLGEVALEGAPRKYRRFWNGIGVGWAAFWLAKSLIAWRKVPMVECGIIEE